MCNVAYSGSSGGSVSDGDGCNSRVIHPYSYGHSHLPRLCTSLSLHLRHHEENHGPPETTHPTCTPTIHVSASVANLIL